jgi:site-specific recombinase XerD
MNNQILLKELERNLKLKNYSSKSIKSYYLCIKLFLEKSDKDADKIKENEIIDFLLLLQEKNKAPKTINLYKQSIKFFFNEIVKSDIKLNIPFSKEVKKLPIVLNKNEIIKLIEIIKNLKHKFIISLSY